MKSIENENLKLTINLHGGSLVSIYDKVNNFELQYTPEEDSWPFQDVVIFPLIGVNKFEYENKDYEIETRHGFLRNEDFKVYKLEENSITIFFESNEVSKKKFPFDFRFFLTYTMQNSTILLKIDIENLNKNIPLPCMYGSHLGLRALETGNINLCVNKELYPLENGLINLEKVIKFDDYLSLNKENFKKYDTLVFKNNSNKVILNNGFGYEIEYNFDSPLFAIWSNSNKGNFVCIEPWFGVSNIVNEEKNIYKKRFINSIKSQKTFQISIIFKKLFNQ